MILFFELRLDPVLLVLQSNSHVVLLAQGLLRDVHCVAEGVERGAQPATLTQQLGQVAHCIESLGVSAPEHLEPALQRFAEVRLGLIWLALRLLEQPQLADTDEGLGMARA